MTELVAFSTEGLDTHGAYTKGIHSGLLKLLKLLNITDAAENAKYTVPISGIYQIYQNNSMRFINVNAGDIIDVVGTTNIHRIGPF